MTSTVNFSFNYHRIRQKRKYLGITQVSLAEIVGVSQGMISQIESGELSPGFKTGIAIMLALELTLEDLLSDKVDSA